MIAHSVIFLIFDQFFIVRLSGALAAKQLLPILPHFKHVATLSCEILMSEY